MSVSGLGMLVLGSCLCFCLYTSSLNGLKCGNPRVRNILDRSLRIIGGSEALRGSHPWLVSLKSRGSHFCGGAVLSERWLLTAAHCVSGPPEDFLRDTEAVVGEFDQRVSDPRAQRFRLRSTRVHERYHRAAPLSYDIALLELDGLIHFGDHAQPICLPHLGEPLAPETPCIASGWGRTRERGRLAAVLQEVQLNPVEPSRCRNLLQTLRPGQRALTALCAGPERGGRDSCQGDSGGPLICPRADGSWVAVGITSWGKGCGRSWINNHMKPPSRRGSPGVFTDVQKLLTWIKRNLRQGVGEPLCSVGDGVLSGAEGMVRNPALPGQDYNNNEVCSWSISVPIGKSILLEFLRFDLENDSYCLSDWLTVFVGKGRAAGRFCGSQIPGPMLIGSHHATVQFVSDVSGRGTGFSIRFRASEGDYGFGPGCGTVVLLQAQGTLQSPHYPQSYGNNSLCRWLLHAPEGHVVKLTFEDFDLEESDGCQYDALTVFGDVDGFDEIVVVCGRSRPPPVLSHSNVMLVQLSTDSSVSARGFSAALALISTDDLQELEEKRVERQEEVADDRNVPRRLQTAECGMPHAAAAGAEQGEGTGSPAEAWQVHITLGTEHVCSGVIVQATWVLTAAHCLHELHGFFSLLTVEAGGTEGQSRGVRHVHLHPLYEPSTQDYDVALLQLDKALSLNHQTQPICLPTAGQEVPPSQHCRAVLWSRGVGGATRRTPWQTEVELIERSDCERTYHDCLTPSMLCVRHTEQGSPDTCTEVSGGPLVCVDNNGRFVVMGVMSWSRDCGNLQNPVVYSSVPFLRDWIQQQLDGDWLDEEESGDEDDYETMSYQQGYW